MEEALVLTHRLDEKMCQVTAGLNGMCDAFLDLVTDDWSMRFPHVAPCDRDAVRIAMYTAHVAAYAEGAAETFLPWDIMNETMSFLCPIMTGLKCYALVYSAATLDRMGYHLATLMITSEMNSRSGSATTSNQKSRSIFKRSLHMISH